MKPLDYYATIDPIELARDPDFRMWVRQSTPELDQFWESVRALYPHQQGTIEQAHLLVAGLEATWQEVTETAIDASFQRLRQKQIERQPEPNRVFFVSRFYRYAAAVTLLLMAGLAGWFYNRMDSSPEYKTAYGQIRTITLPDGSVVTLNANSTLQLADDWKTQERREVRLTGEAFFDVHKKPQGRRKPFVVHTDAGDVVVLGTRFNVNTRRTRTQVILEEGQVKVALPKQPDVLMQPGDLLETTNGGTAIHRAKVDAGRYVAWRQNLLVMEDEQLRDVVQRLNDQYGLHVTITNKKLLAESFTGSVPVDRPELLLRLIAEAFHLKMNKKQNQIVLSN